MLANVWPKEALNDRTGGREQRQIPPHLSEQTKDSTGLEGRAGTEEGKVGEEERKDVLGAVPGMGKEGAVRMLQGQSVDSSNQHPSIAGATLGTKAGHGGSAQPEEEGRAGAQRVQSTLGFSALTQGILPEQCQELWGPALHGKCQGRPCRSNVRVWEKNPDPFSALRMKKSRLKSKISPMVLLNILQQFSTGLKSISTKWCKLQLHCPVQEGKHSSTKNSSNFQN